MSTSHNFESSKKHAHFMRSPSHRGAVPLGGRFKLLAAILILSLPVAGYWAYHAVMETLYGLSSEVLEAILEADVTALRLWVEEQKSDVELWAENEAVRRSVAGLAESARDQADPRQALLTSTHLSDLRRDVQDALEAGDHPTFMVISQSGLVLADLRDAFVGLELSGKHRPNLSRLFLGERIMTKPFLQGSTVGRSGGEPNKPIMAVGAPVRDLDGRIVAGLFFAIRPEKDFTRILSLARVGKSGDTYAFDENGVMLSDSRHDEQLKTLGLIPNEPEARSILQVLIRDPGGDLSRGYKPGTPLPERPFTELVASAVDAEEGIRILLDPYRDYRGVKVIGAYFWTPEQGLGVATEVELREVQRILRPLWLAFMGLSAAIAVGAVAILITWFINQKLKARVKEIHRLGQYTLERKIGEGGMGKVYLARHAMLRRPTAVKFLDPDRVSSEAIARFEKEVQLTSRLANPNTVEVYDYGHTPEGIFYYAMEYLPGITLAQLIEMDGAVPPARVIHILKQVCSSLSEAHGLGVIHRDIKPLNIMLCQLGGRADVVKVLDFGLVREVAGAGEADVRLTSANVVPGTPAYIAPERLQDPLAGDARADIYCVGAVGFNLLTGRDVFEGTSAVDIAVHVLKTPAPRPSDKVDHPIPAALDRLIVDCLAKDADDRPQSAAEILDVLAGLEKELPWTRETAHRWWEDHAEEIERILGHGTNAEDAGVPHEFAKKP